MHLVLAERVSLYCALACVALTSLFCAKLLASDVNRLRNEFSLHLQRSQLKAQFEKSSRVEENEVERSFFAETQAALREFSSKYVASDLPLEVRHWFTYVSKNVDFLKRLPQDDPLLVRFVKENLLVAPAPEFESQKWAIEEVSSGPTATALYILDEKRNGTYVESGDLMDKSASLLLEKQFGWRGVLIEEQPDNFQRLLHQRRNAFLVPACLSAVTPNPQMVGAVQCVPLTSILLAANATHVDFLKLKLPLGNELAVLQTIDFHQISIELVMINFGHSKAAIERYMHLKGYQLFQGEGVWVLEYLLFVKQKPDFYS